MRNRESQQRLAFEEKLFERYMPNFSFHDRNGDTNISGWQSSRSGQTRCELTLTIPEGYPYEMPRLFVTSPTKLWKYQNRGTVNAESRNHSFHTNSNGPGGIVQICHTEPWDPSTTCLKVIARGALWVEGLEANRCTGMTIAEFIDRFREAVHC